MGPLRGDALSQKFYVQGHPMAKCPRIPGVDFDEVEGVRMTVDAQGYIRFDVNYFDKRERAYSYPVAEVATWGLVEDAPPAPEPEWDGTSYPRRVLDLG